MKCAYILSFFLTLILLAACPLYSEGSIQKKNCQRTKKIKSLSNVDSIFPVRLTAEKLEKLDKLYAGNMNFIRLWKSMKPLYTYFEKEQKLPTIKTSSKGFYKIEIS